MKDVSERQRYSRRHCLSPSACVSVGGSATGSWVDTQEERRWVRRCVGRKTWNKKKYVYIYVTKTGTRLESETRGAVVCSLYPHHVLELSTSPLEECVSVLPSHTPHLALSKPHQPICEHDVGLLSVACCACTEEVRSGVVSQLRAAVTLRQVTYTGY